MTIIIIDDEYFALKDLTETINAVIPEAVIYSFLTIKEGIEFATDNNIDVAFLDIEMSGMNGLELSKKFKEINAKTNIIFVTGYSEYAVDAFSVFASGYILKPASEKAVSKALRNLRFQVKPDDTGLTVKTFGNFEVFFNGIPVYFPRSRSKELFAYLVHKKGASCTVKELSAVIFEDKEYSVSMQKQMQTIISTMLKVLCEINSEAVILKKRNSIAVDRSKINCDYYRFLEFDTAALNLFCGEYMSSYSWAEFTIGYLESIAKFKKNEGIIK